VSDASCVYFITNIIVEVIPHHSRSKRKIIWEKTSLFSAPITVRTAGKVIISIRYRDKHPDIHECFIKVTPNKAPKSPSLQEIAEAFQLVYKHNHVSLQPPGVGLEELLFYNL